MKEHGSFNRCYRLLWSGTTAQWKPVPETARTAKKGGRGKAANTLTLAGVLPGVAMSLFVMSNLAAQPPPAPPTAPATTQLPTGGNVVGGQATISQSAIATAANMVVNQSSQRAIIDWSSFNLGASATVQFVQPNAQSVILNRVLDPNPTQVFGRINANGQVFLTNPYGVYFAPSASVDVGGLVATTYSISNDDFMSGRYTFNRNGSTASVVNQGNLSASLGGYIALLAPEVQNSGVVVARAGTVAFAAGEQVSLTMLDGKGLSGITTTASAIASLIDNKLAVQAPDGQIILSAVAVNKLQGGVIKNSGSLQATSLSNQGGKIVLEGDEIELASTASIDVSGRTRGGTVLMGGDWQGSGNLRQATKVSMAAGATINANATDSGDGGKVVLWSNVSDANSTTTVAGSIYASAGPNGGNGGQIETSGHYLNVDGIQVSTLAPKGAMGEWLLDPANITISSSADANYSNASGTFTPNSNNTTSTINNATLSTALGTTSITVTTVNNGTAATGSGAINIAGNLSWNSASTLTLIANDSISGTGNISMTGGGSVVFNTSNATTTAAYSGVISGNGSISKQGLGKLNLTGNSTYSGGTTVAAGNLIDSQSNTTATADGNGNYTFTSSGVGTGTVKVLDGATLSLGASLNISNYMEIQGTGAIGTPGALTLATASSVYGNTLLKAGGTVVGGSGYFRGDILDNGQGLGLTFNATGTLTMFGSKSYSGTSNITGPGSTSLFAPSMTTSATFNTSFNISSGSGLLINAPNGAGTEINISGDISGAGNLSLNQLTSTANTSLMGKLSLTGTVNSSGTSNLILKNNSDYTIASVLTGNGSLTQASSGNLTLSANSTGFTGKLNINSGGTVTIGDGNTSGIINASIANNGTLNFNRTDAVTAPGAISGTGVLNKYGSNVLTLSGNNTFTGNITVGAGTLKAGFAGSTNYGAFGNQTNITLTDLSGVGLDISGFSISIGSLTGGANNTLNLGASSLTTGLNGLSTTYAGTVLGSGTLSKSGAGTFNLSGNSSTFTGGLVISAGDLVLTNTSVIGSGAQLINVSGATGMLELQNISSFRNPVCLSALGATLNISGGNTTMNGTLTMCTALGNTLRIAQNSSLTTTGTLNASNSDVKKYGLGTWIVAEPSVSTATQALYTIDVYEGRAELNSTKWSFGSTASPSIAANATLKLGAFAGSSVFSGSNTAAINNNGVLQFAPSSTSYNSWWYYVNGTGSVEFMGSVPTLITTRQLAYTGSTTIFPNASVKVDDSNSHLGNTSQAILNNGDLTITSGNSQNWVQGITGSGNVTFDASDSAGTVVVRPLGMKAANSYTGTTTLTNRVTLYLGGQSGSTYTSNASLGTGDIIFQGANSTLCITRTSDITLTNNMSGPGSISLSSSNVTTTLAGNVNIGGNITMNGSNTTLVIAPTGSLGANGVFASSIILNTSNTTLEYASASDVCITGNLSGGYGSLRKTTSNSNLTLTGNNNINGGVWIEAGALYALGANTSSGKLGTGNISNNATLVFNHTDTGNLSLSSLGGNITGTGNVTFISVGNITLDKTINLSGTNSLIKIQSNANVTLNSSLTSSGSNGKIILAAGAATGAGTATGGQIAINTSVNVTLNNSGSVVMFQGNNSANLTATMDARVIGATTTNVPKYKTYNASLGNVTSAVTGTRNYFYRVQPTATINGGTVTATKVYDGTTTATPSYTGGGSVTGVDGDTLTGCVTGASYNTSSAGNKSLTYNVALASNSTSWVVSGYAGAVNPTSTVANITQAPLTIQANDAADFVTLAASSGPFAGVSYSGFVHGENATTAGLTGTLNISRAAGNSAGTYALTPSGLSANNYAISYRPGNYTIVPAQQLIIRVSDGTNVYGDASNLSVSSVTYLMPDNVTIANLTSSLTTNNGLYSINDGVGGTASFKLGLSNANLTASSHAAVGLWNVSYNNLTIGGSNFNTIIAVGTQSITKRDLTLTTVADNKVYDGNTNATFNISTNRITGDALTLSTDALGVFANRNAANGTVVTVGNITISGNDASNYNLLSNVSSTTANITPKTLTLSGLTANNKVYDATANATIATLGTLNGVLGFDDVQVGTSAVTGTFNDKNVGNGKTVTLAGFTMGGAEAGNYKIDSATTTANITPKALTVSGLSVASSKVYDGTNVAAPLGTANLQDAIAAGTGTSSDGKAYSGDSIGITGTPVGTYNSKDVATAANVSITGLTLTNNTLGNYVLTAPTPLAATITPKDLTIKVNDDAQFFTITSNTVGFNGVSYKGFVTGESSANLTFSNSSAPGVPNISTSLNATQKSTTGVYAGALTLDGTVTNSNYNITVQTGNFTVVGADQLLVRVNNVNTTYGTAANLVVGSAQYVSNNTNVLLNLNVSSSGNQVTVDDGLGSGGGAVMTLSPTVLASQLSGSNNAKVGIYNIGGTVTCVTSGVNFNSTVVVVGTETVTAKALTATATAANKTYNSNASATVTVTSSDVITGDTLDYLYTSAEFLNKNVGTNKAVTVANISLNGTDAGNYVIQNLVASTTANITQKALTITGITAENKVYNGTTAAVVNVSAVNSTSLVGMGLVTGDNLTLSATGAFTDKNAGNGKTVNLTSTYAGADVGNYLITSQANTTANITQKTLTITGITAGDKAYNGTNVAAVNVSALNSTSLVGMGMLANDTVTVSATGVFADKNVGANKTVNLTSTYGGSDAGNYNIVSQVNTTANITAKDVTLAAPQATQVYNGSAIYTANATQLAALSTELGVVGDSVTGVTLTYNNPNAATGKTLTASSAVISDGNGGHNYNVSYTTNTTSVITAKDVTLAAPQATRAYDGTANYTANVTQLAALTSALGVAGDSVSNITLVYNDQNAATGKTLTASSAVISDGNSGHNYNVSYATNTTSVITAKDVTLVAPQVTRTYDGTVNYTANATQLAALTSALGVAGDSVTSVLLAYNDKNVGTGRTLTASNAVVSDGNNGLNYNISYTNNTASVITTKDVTLAAPQASRAYDGTVSYTANATQLAALSAALGVAGDSVTNITLAYNSPNAATGKTLTASNAVVSDGNNGLNYNISYAGNNASVITAKTLTISGITAENKTYDGNTTAVVNVSAVNSTSLVGMGLVSGDNVSVTATGVFADKEVGTHKTVTLSSTYGGSDAGNYNINSQASTWADITAAMSSSSSNQNQNQTTPVDNTVFGKLLVPPVITVPPAPVSQRTPIAMPSLSLSDAKETKSDITDDSMSSQKALAMVTQIRTPIVELAAIPTTPLALPAPLAAPATSVAMAAPSSPSQAAASNAPPPPLASTASTSGVLPVSVLGDSRVSNLGMTYSEQPNDIRIQMTTSPDVPKLTATAIRFTGNFKTFIVNNDRGEMVPYQGAMIGKRIVILAETEASKNLARQEMQTVLAAAITTLGSSGSISLAQVEGVVLDLR